MILPIIAYGDPVLRKVGEGIDENYPQLKELIANMYETMYNARGVGLAAPQIGLSIRLFVVDLSPFDDDEEDIPAQKKFKKVFINAHILEEEGKDWPFNEGCLSIPEIREDVTRKEKILISYYDENFNHFEEEYSGIIARVIQHEYDHIEGKLFVDKISAIKKRLIVRKLEAISKGIIKPDYKMKYPALKKARKG